MRPILLLAAAGAGGLAASVGLSVGVVRWAARGRLYEEETVPSAPIGLVLGAQVYPGGTPSRFLLGRLELARRLYDSSRVTSIIVSGDSLAAEGNEPAAMRQYLIDAGVPESVIISDPAGFDTYDSCVRAKIVYGVEKVIIVSQRYHLPRAVGTARLVGLDAVGVGDRSVEWVHRGGRPRRSEPWLRGTVRDQLACVKTIMDVITRRRPEHGRTILR